MIIPQITLLLTIACALVFGTWVFEDLETIRVWNLFFALCLFLVAVSKTLSVLGRERATRNAADKRLKKINRRAKKVRSPARLATGD